MHFQSLHFKLFAFRAVLQHFQNMSTCLVCNKFHEKCKHRHNISIKDSCMQPPDYTIYLNHRQPTTGMFRSFHTFFSRTLCLNVKSPSKYYYSINENSLWGSEKIKDGVNKTILNIIKSPSPTTAFKVLVFYNNYLYSLNQPEPAWASDIDLIKRIFHEQSRFCFAQITFTRELHNFQKLVYCYLCIHIRPNT